LPETLKVVNARVNKTDWDPVAEIGHGKTSTAKKFLNEINKRLDLLTPAELELLYKGERIVQKQLAFLSICKVHWFIRDFTVEVLREKFLVFDYQITDGEYLSFFRSKAEVHSEMENLTETSEKKIMQVTFKILEQAEIIDHSQRRNIQPQFLDSKTIQIIAADHPDWLKIFLMSDSDINALTRTNEKDFGPI